jgi:hypothetical protein
MLILYVFLHDVVTCTQIFQNKKYALYLSHLFSFLIKLQKFAPKENTDPKKSFPEKEKTVIESIGIWEAD